jgi:hypothetical protein
MINVRRISKVQANCPIHELNELFPVIIHNKNKIDLEGFGCKSCGQNVIFIIKPRFTQTTLFSNSQNYPQFQK